MDIKYLGHSSFQIKGKTESVVTDPYDSKMTGLKFPKIEAGIVTISHQHGDHNDKKAVDGATLVLDIPGDYEKNGVRITGYHTYHDAEKGAKRGLNTMFKIEMEGMTVLHCGDLGHTIDDELAEEINNVDILMVPVGGFYTIDAKGAYEVIKALEPTIVIPMHYRTDKHDSKAFGEVAPLSDFLKVMDITTIEPVKKLSLKKDDLASGEMKVVVMETA